MSYSTRSKRKITTTTTTTENNDDKTEKLSLKKNAQPLSTTAIPTTMMKIENDSEMDEDPDDPEEEEEDEQDDDSNDENENMAEEIEIQAEERLLFDDVTNHRDVNALNGISDHYFLRKSKSRSKKPKQMNGDGDNHCEFFEQFENSIEMMNEMKFIETIDMEMEQIRRELRINHDELDMQRYLQLLMERFNIILYGYGSKIKILQHFIDNYLHDRYHYIIIRGYEPELTMKHILIILNRPLGNGLDSLIMNHDKLFEELNEMFNDQQQQHLFIVIHSIDRLIQEDRKNLMKNFLVKLFTSVHNIHLITSADTVYGDFLWTQQERDQLRLHSMPLNTYQPYIIERRSINGAHSSLWWLPTTSSRSIGSRMMSANFSSVTYVYESLNDNAKKIFIIILKHFLDMGKSSRTMKLDELYRICREEFLTSSLSTIRQQLTEFKDHKLLKFRTDIGGSECLSLSFDLDVVRKFLDSIND